MDVEVGGRLVHQEEIRRIDEKLHQVESGLLAAAQDRGLLEDIILAEEEGTENPPGIILGEFAVASPDLFEDRLVGVERGGTVLAEVANLRIRPLGALPLLELEHSSEDLEQG